MDSDWHNSNWVHGGTLFETDEFVQNHFESIHPIDGALDEEDDDEDEENEDEIEDEVDVLEETENTVEEV